MRQAGRHSQHSRGRMFVRCAAIAAGVAVVLAACGDDSGSSTGTTAAATAPADPVAAAQAQVTTAQSNLDTANGSLTSAQKQFCSDASNYVAVLDRYGKLFTPDSKATVGDVKTGRCRPSRTQGRGDHLGDRSRRRAERRREGPTGPG